jgi:hypothetical protein
VIGLNHTTGLTLEGVAHLNQSIGRILSTPLGSRLARRDFGAELFDLIDAPSNAATRVRLFAAVATALMRWEPRLKLMRVGLAIDLAAPGTLVIEVEGITAISRERINTTVAVNLGSVTP